MGGAVPCLQQWKTFFLGVNELFADRVQTFLHDHLCNGTLDTYHFSCHPVQTFNCPCSYHSPPPPLMPSITVFLVPVTHFFIRRIRKISKSDRCDLRRVRPHGTFRLPPDGFLLNLIFEHF